MLARELFEDALRQAEGASAVGERAASPLSGIPDPDLRPQAEIEFAAVLAGLPAHPGIRASAPRTRASA